MKVAKRLWHVMIVLYCMARKNISKNKFMLNLNLHLLLERSKILGKSVGDGDVRAGRALAFGAPNPDAFGRGDAGPRVRQVRVTDSPFPVSGPEEGGNQVDREAEEFIRRFYECLRLQQDEASSGLES